MYDFFWGKAPDHLLNIMNSFLKMRALAINIGSNHVQVNCVKILKHKIQNTFCNLVSQFFDKNHFNLYYDLVHCLIKRNLGERIFISENFPFGLNLVNISSFRTKISPQNFFQSDFTQEEKWWSSLMRALVAYKRNSCDCDINKTFFFVIFFTCGCNKVNTILMFP